MYGIISLLAIIAYISIIANWLIGSGAIKTDNKIVPKIKSITDKVLLPVYKQIRKVVQPVNGMDFTPLVAIVIVVIIEQILFIIF